MIASVCSQCSKDLRIAVKNDGGLKSCPECSAEAGHHVFYKDDWFKTSDLRITPNNETGLQSWCLKHWYERKGHVVQCPKAVLCNGIVRLPSRTKNTPPRKLKPSSLNSDVIARIFIEHPDIGSNDTSRLAIKVTVSRFLSNEGLLKKLASRVDAIVDELISELVRAAS